MIDLQLLLFFWLTLFALPNCLSTDRESDKLLCTLSGSSIKSHCLFASQIIPPFAFWIHLLVQLPKDAAVSLYYRNCRESFPLDLLTEIFDSSLPRSLLCGYTVWTSRTSRDKRHQRALDGAPAPSCGGPRSERLPFTPTAPRQSHNIHKDVHLSPPPPPPGGGKVFPLNAGVTE